MNAQSIFLNLVFEVLNTEERKHNMKTEAYPDETALKYLEG